MVSLEAPPATGESAEQIPGHRKSFSGDLLDDANFISINPHNKEKPKTVEFEFLSTALTAPATMLTADELFFEGKLRPFGQKQCCLKLEKMNIRYEEIKAISKPEDVKVEDHNRMGWFIDEDPSPRPPKCTVLWKELLRLRKHRDSSLSVSASTSSSSSSSSSSFDDDLRKKEKNVKRGKKGLERTRSAGLKIRPMVNVPVCGQGGRSYTMPVVYSGRKGMLDR